MKNGNKKGRGFQTYVVWIIIAIVATFLGKVLAPMFL
jgi:hypothetical protein